MRRRLATAIVLVCGLTPPVGAAAQTGQSAQIPLQFDFLNPGARSLGLASAFVAVADDATAAFTNPAGLSKIDRPEVSAELRYRRLATTYLAGGRLNGTPTGNGIDTLPGPVYGESIDTAWRPYYLSVVIPRNRWRIAAYRHELVLQKNEFVSDGPYVDVNVSGTTFGSRLFGLAGEREARVDNYGVSGSYRFSERLAVGAGVSLYWFDLESSFGSLYFTDSFGHVDPSTRGRAFSTTQDGSNTAFGFNIGVLYDVNSKVRIGGAYRGAASFEFEQEDVIASAPTSDRIGNFRTPSVVGLGVRILARDDLAIAMEYDRVEYSRLTTDFITFQVDPPAVSRVDIPDGNEFHVGVDYTLLNVAKTPSISFGVWYDPKHGVTYDPDGSGSVEDLLLQSVFRGGESLWHYTFGFGLPLSRNYEVNVGADLTGERRYFSASLVARFGR